MDRSRLRAEQLLSLSGAARRVSDLVAAAEQPLHYEVMRHLLRVSEETMTEVLEEAVGAELVKRGDEPFHYVPYTPALGEELRDAMGSERLAKLRAHIQTATTRVLLDEDLPTPPATSPPL
jgi:hypothetical protein